jgi:hypothetical protein
MKSESSDCRQYLSKEKMQEQEQEQDVADLLENIKQVAQLVADLRNGLR